MERLEVVPGEEIGVVSPYLHGHFAEHLGELVYPGIWVDPDGPVPNDGGLRRDVIAALRPLEIPVLRWPGGCFADDYHWRDGVGPQQDRPLRLNRHWGMAEEPNRFGTHEFMRFCRALGAEPYIAGNVGSGTPAELQAWVEYCNFPGRSALADERRANGDDAPFGVRLWGIGNENWACGGWMSPEYYAEEYCRFRSYLSDYGGTPVRGIACGPNNADWEWTRRFFAAVRNHPMPRLRLVQGFAAHFYCGTAGTATQFTDDQWLELLCRARAVEGVIAGTRALMDEHDPARQIPLLLDEWGAWHPVERGKPPHGLCQQNSQRDACVAAISLDVFHRFCDRLWMANIAQLINVLQSLLLVEEDRVVRTPTYHVFALYRCHRGARAVRCESLSPAVSDGGPSAEWCRTRSLDRRPIPLRAVEGSASVRDGALAVTAVNACPERSVELEVGIHGAAWSGEAEAVLLTSDDLRACNTLDHPDRVTPSPALSLPTNGRILRITLPPGAVVRLRGRLA